MDLLSRSAVEHFEKNAIVPTKVETVITPYGNKIVFVKDTDGIQIPVVVPKFSRKSNEILDIIHKDGWQENLVLPGSKNIQRFVHCVNNLAMPYSYAAFLGFASDENLDNYKVPASGTQRPLFVTIGGESSPIKGEGGVGKSTVSAVLAERLKEKYNTKIFDLETLYAENATMYSKIIDADKNWDGSYKSAVDIINAGAWNDKLNKKPSGQVKSLRTLIEGAGTNQGLEYFRKTAERPKIIICDKAGDPRKSHTAEGQVIHDGRGYVARDFFGFGDGPYYHINRKLVIESAHTGYKQMDAKIDRMVKEIENKLKK